MFINMNGERFNVLMQGEAGAWVISYDNYGMPVYIDRQHLNRAERIAPPEEYVANKSRKYTDAQQKRYELMEPLINDPLCITDAEYRKTRVDALAMKAKTTKRRLYRLFYSYLAHGCLTQSRQRESMVRKDFDAAIRKYYFSAKRNSLRMAYELFVLENYTNNGIVCDDPPSWNSFRHYFYRHWGRSKEKEIARNGLSNYQRNERPLYGSAMQYRDCIGCFQMDETPADIFLVSKWDRSKVIGRPNVYMAVDTASGLIAGIYVGLEAGEDAMAACIANAAEDKVSFCAKYGITIDPSDWPSYGLPSEIISDRGREFAGDRMDEFCRCYGIDCQNLPPFRAEEKPLVERMMGMIQDNYRSLLRGRGIVGNDVAERWATDYRKQAILTLDEYIAIALHCVITLNTSRVLTSLGHLPIEAPNTPTKLWAWLQNQGKTTILDVDAKEVYLRSLPRSTAKVSRKGVFHNHMRYLPEKGQELTIGLSVEFAYDPSNSSEIFILQDNRSFLPCRLAPSSSRYDGYGLPDVSVIRKEEMQQKREAREAELNIRVKMHHEIQSIIDHAESQRERNMNVKEIAQSRDAERSRQS